MESITRVRRILRAGVPGGRNFSLDLGYLILQGPLNTQIHEERRSHVVGGCLRDHPTPQHPCGSWRVHQQAHVWALDDKRW